MTYKLKWFIFWSSQIFWLLLILVGLYEAYQAGFPGPQRTRLAYGLSPLDTAAHLWLRLVLILLAFIAFEISLLLIHLSCRLLHSLQLRRTNRHYKLLGNQIQTTDVRARKSKTSFFKKLGFKVLIELVVLTIVSLLFGAGSLIYKGLRLII